MLTDYCMLGIDYCMLGAVLGQGFCPYWSGVLSPREKTDMTIKWGEYYDKSEFPRERVWGRQSS